MKKFILITFVLSLSTAFSISIPEKIIGQYQAEIPSFEFEDNGRTVHAAGYTLNLLLREDYMWYKTDMLEFYGEYTDLKEKGDIFDVSIAVSNDLSIDFDLDISYNKKTGSLAVKGMKGLPEVELTKRREIKVNKKK